MALIYTDDRKAARVPQPSGGYIALGISMLVPNRYNVPQGYDAVPPSDR